MSFDYKRYTVLVSINSIANKDLISRLRGTNGNKYCNLDYEIFVDKNKLFIVLDGKVEDTVILEESIFNTEYNPTTEWGMLYIDHDFNLMRKPSSFIAKVIRFFKNMKNRTHFIPN